MQSSYNKEIKHRATKKTLHWTRYRSLFIAALAKKINHTNLQMKDREEYLTEFENKLLLSFSGAHRSTNKLFIFAYSLVALLTFLNWGAIEKIVFLGATLKIDESNIYLAIPFIIITLYVLINYNLIRLRWLSIELNSNSKEILLINENSRPVTINDMRFFEEGITGLIMSLARWQVNRLLDNKPIQNESDLIVGLKFIFQVLLFIIRILNWIFNIVIRPITLIAIFYAPLLLAIYQLYSKFGFNTVAYSFLITLLGIMSVVTFICVLLLFASYFIEIWNSIKDEISEKAKTIGETADKLIQVNRIVRHLENIIDVLMKIYT